VVLKLFFFDFFMKRLVAFKNILFLMQQANNNLPKNEGTFK